MLRLINNLPDKVINTLICIIAIASLAVFYLGYLYEDSSYTRDITAEVVDCYAYETMFGTHYNIVLKYDNVVQEFDDIQTYANCKGKDQVKTQLQVTIRRFHFRPRAFYEIVGFES